jgi:hypothetical protein
MTKVARAQKIAKIEELLTKAERLIHECRLSLKGEA